MNYPANVLLIPGGNHCFSLVQGLELEKRWSVASAFSMRDAEVLSGHRTSPTRSRSPQTGAARIRVTFPITEAFLPPRAPVC